MYLLFIVNPTSGNGRGKRVWSDVEKVLQQRNLPYQVRFTQKPEDGTEYVHQYLSEYAIDQIKGIIAVGGDGTLHEVINGIQQSNQDLPFGMIPAGSGNDFTRVFHLGNCQTALEHILIGHTMKVDIGVVDEQYYFINNIGAGFDGEVSYVANRSQVKKWLNYIKLGKVVYILTLIRILFSFKRVTLSIRLNGHTRSWKKAWFVAVANIMNYGGGMKICPGAKPDDGEFQLCVVHGISPLELLFVFPKVFKGTHIGHRGVELLHASELEIETSSPCHVHMDGEVKVKTPIKIKLLHRKQTIFIPA